MPTMACRSRILSLLKWVCVLVCALSIVALAASLWVVVWWNDSHFVPRFRIYSGCVRVLPDLGWNWVPYDTYDPRPGWHVDVLQPPERARFARFVWLPRLEPEYGFGGPRVTVPLWTPILAFGIPAACLSASHRRRPAGGHCVECGYNLTGNVSGRCPECGTAVKPEGQPR